MSSVVSRRKLLTGAAAIGGAVVLPSEIARADNVPTTATACPPSYPGSTVTPADQRYGDLVRNWNGRFTGSPDYVRVVGTTADVQLALAEAVRSGKQLAVRSGGHCLENFVANPAVRIQIDMGSMTSIYYDPQYNAIAIEPGATLREVYKTLYTRWGVTIPGGICPSVGVGGHVSGGGYGPLARRSGIVPDHLYAVELVTVDSSGTPCTVVATRENNDPNRELWWAHTGGGGGNFGVVTKYWMRSNGTTGTNPGDLLPKPPKMARLVTMSWQWSALNEQTFSRLVKNYMNWHVANSAPGAAATRLSADFFGLHVNSSPVVSIRAIVDPTENDSASLLAGFRAAVSDSVGVTPSVSESTHPWLEATNVLGPSDAGPSVRLRNKVKGSYIRLCYTDEQLATTYRYLTDPSIRSPLAGVLFGSYGGKANSVAPAATASPQRDSVLKALHPVYWADPSQDNLHLSWLRNFYRDVHATTGGVPGLDGVTDGSYINYADTDLADPAWNKSGTPWSTLYYKGNYRRLQAVKAKWDPLNVFRHALSIQA
jgi:FAD/FMN-containing dehydrogenase